MSAFQDIQDYDLNIDENEYQYEATFDDHWEQPTSDHDWNETDPEDIYLDELLSGELMCNHPECREPWSQLDKIVHHGHYDDFSIYGGCEDCLDIGLCYGGYGCVCKKRSIVSPEAVNYRILSNIREKMTENEIYFDISYDRFKYQLAKAVHKYHLRNYITEELIATVMHPSRIQAQMNQSDDVEQFFEMMGC